MQIKDFEELIAELNAIDISLKQSIDKLESFDIHKQLRTIEVTNLRRAITQKLEEEIEKAIKKIEERNLVLNQKIEQFDVAIDGLSEIQLMSDNVNNITKFLKSFKIKTITVAIVSSLFFGVFTGVYISSIKEIIKNDIENLDEFRDKYPSFTIAKDENKFYLVFDKKVNLKKFQNQNGEKIIGFEK